MMNSDFERLLQEMLVDPMDNAVEIINRLVARYGLDKKINIIDDSDHAGDIDALGMCLVASIGAASLGVLSPRDLAAFFGTIPRLLFQLGYCAALENPNYDFEL